MTDQPPSIDKMEADMRRLAQNVRPGLNQARSDDRVTATHLNKALDQLTQAASEQADEAWALAKQLTGIEDSGGPQPAEGALKAGPVFEGLARQITDVGRQLARLKRAQEAIARALS
jgi:hypothetical protein